ncbi:FtsX-like permease family protein [Candidatus Poribacteria bacterium]|nr:FtsX-like permease family protein [Candidatus Poribacteria bacterium]
MAYIWSETFSNIRHSGLIGILSVIVIALTAMVVSVLLMVANYIHAELNIVKQSPLIVAFLQEGLDDDTRQDIGEKIKALPQVYSTLYVSKKDALEKTREMFSDQEEILEGLEDFNPLPESYEIELKAEYIGSERILVSNLKAIPGIEDIQYAQETSRFVRNIELVTLFIGIILGLASVVIICFSIIVTTYIRRDEIVIMRLVGATGLFIRIPLLLQGIVQGLLGSGIGMACLYGILYLLAPRFGHINFLPPIYIAAVVIAGGLIGFIGGALPLRRFIKA